MSGNGDEMPDAGGSTRLSDRETSEFQQRQQQQRQRQQALEQRRQQAAEQLGLERADLQPAEFDSRGNVVGFGVTGAGQAELEADAREEIAGSSEFIEPGDVSVDVSPSGVEDAGIAEDSRSEVAQRAREQVASRADFLEEQDVDVTVGETGIENIDVDETAAVRRQATEQAIEADPFVDEAADVDVSVSRTDSGEFNVETERAGDAAQAATAVENLSQLEFRLSPTGPSPSSVTLQDQFSQLTKPDNVTAISVGGNRQVINFRDRTSISPTFADASGEASSEFFFGLRDLDRETRSELTIADLGQDPEFLQEGIEDVRRQNRRDAIQDELDAAGVDDLGASVSLDGDVVLQDEQNRTGSGADIDAAAAELRENQLDAARFDAAEQIDSETPGVDVRSSDLQRSGGEFSLDAETQQAVEDAQQQQARRDAAQQFDEQLGGVGVGADDVRLNQQGGETIAELDAATQDAVLNQQRSQARQEAAQQFDAETGVDVGAEDIEVQQTDEGFEATLDDETEADVRERRQDIAEEITPDGSLAAADAQQRFANFETRTPSVSERLGVDRDAEPSQAASVAGDIGQFLREDVLPAGGGAALGAAASTFSGPFDPGRDATEAAVDRLEGPADQIDDAAEAGIDVSTDVTGDIVAGATPLPDAVVDPAFDTLEGGAEIGAESLNPARIAQDTARAPGLTLRGADAVTNANAAENIQFGADVAEAGGELAVDEGPTFVRENPQRAAELGLGAGIAIGGGALLGTAATRGTAGAARGARSALGDIDIGTDARRFAADDRGQLDFSVGDGDGDTPTVEIDEPDDFDPQRVTREEVFDAPEAGPRRPETDFSQSFSQRDVAPRRDAPSRFDRGESAAEANPSFGDRATFDAGLTISRDAVAPDVDVGDAAAAVRRRTDAVDGAVGLGGRTVGATVGALGTIPPDPIDAARVDGFAGAALEDTSLTPAVADGDLTAAAQQRRAAAEATAVGVGEELDSIPRPLTDVDAEGATATDTRQGALTDQLLEQDQAVATTGIQTTTVETRLGGRTTQTAPRTPTTTRTRPDIDLPELDSSDERRRGFFGAIGATFQNPTRTLTEADELVTEIGGEFDAGR